MARANTLSQLSTTLKNERAALGLTQKEAAEKLKISLKSLRNLEQGHGGVTLESATEILKLFGKEIRIGDVVVAKKSSTKKRPRRQEIVEALKLVKPILQNKFNVTKLVLFGSAARDKATRLSDIDIAVQFRATPTFSTIGRMTAFLEALFDGHTVDLVELDRMKPEVRAAAKRDFINV